MPEIDDRHEAQLREIAYFLWLHEGCPEGRADHHWLLACGMLSVQTVAALEEEAKAPSPVSDAGSDTPAIAEAPAKS